MSPSVRKSHLLVHRVEDEMVVYDRTRKRAHRLNETASRVWDLLDGDRTTREIASELGVDERVVVLSVDHLASAHLIERGQSLSVSRRDALRTAASAAAVGFLLPTVTSIAAPFAAQAQSKGNGEGNKGVGSGNGGGNGKDNEGGGNSNGASNTDGSSGSTSTSTSGSGDGTGTGNGDTTGGGAGTGNGT